MAHLLLVCCALVRELRSGGDGCFRNSPTAHGIGKIPPQSSKDTLRPPTHHPE